jgi:hypothetical protein
MIFLRIQEAEFGLAPGEAVWHVIRMGVGDATPALTVFIAMK